MKKINALLSSLVFHVVVLALFCTFRCFGCERSQTPTPHQSPEQNKSKAFALKALLKDLENNKIELNQDLDICNALIKDYHDRVGLNKYIKPVQISTNNDRRSPSSNLGSYSGTFSSLSYEEELLRNSWLRNKISPSPESNK